MNRDAHIARLQAILDVVMPHLLAEYRSGGGSPEFRQAVEAAAGMVASRRIRDAIEAPPSSEELVFLKKSRRPTRKQLANPKPTA